jgi:hypothetical protein
VAGGEAHMAMRAAESDKWMAELSRSPCAYIGHLLDTKVRQRAKPLKSMALPSGIEPLSPP